MTETIERYAALPEYPPALEGYPDETCSGGAHDLYEPVYAEELVERINGRWRATGYRYLCAECTRAQALEHYRLAPDTCLDDPPPCVERVERCDRCARYRCTCPEPGE